MGQYASKCCKKAPEALRDELVPLVDVEKGGKGDGAGVRSKDRGGISGQAGQDSAAEGGGAGDPPVEPDPAVFYARSTVTRARSMARSVEGARRKGTPHARARGSNNDTARETGSSAGPKLNKHHHRSNRKIGEETILQFHQDHPTKAPLVGSSSEEEQDGTGRSGSRGASKVWIGVCSARLQNRVWWCSVTFVLCFIVGAGVVLGFCLNYESGQGSTLSPLYPSHETPAATNDGASGAAITPSSPHAAEGEEGETAGGAHDGDRGPILRRGSGTGRGQVSRVVNSKGAGGTGYYPASGSWGGYGEPSSRWPASSGSREPSSQSSARDSVDNDSDDGGEAGGEKDSGGVGERRGAVGGRGGGGRRGAGSNDGGGGGGRGGVKGHVVNRREAAAVGRSSKTLPGGVGNSGSSVQTGIGARRHEGDEDGGDSDADGSHSLASIEEDPLLKADVKDAVARLLRKQIADIAAEQIADIAAEHDESQYES